MKYLGKKNIFLIGVCAVALSACGDMHHPTFITPHRAQVTTSSFEDNVPASSVDAAFIESLAEAYRRAGQGALDVTVTYDPRSSINTAMNAGNRAASIARALQGQGISNSNVSTLPVHNQGSDSRVLVSFSKLTSSAPRGCEALMTGVDDPTYEINEQYRLGCTIEAYRARQTRPVDLAGRAPPEITATDGRRSGNIIEPYRAGAKNEKLEGESASGN